MTALRAIGARAAFHGTPGGNDCSLECVLSSSVSLARPQRPLTSPSSRGPGRGPFKAKTRVRIPLGTPPSWTKVRRPNLSVTRHGSPNQIGSLSRF
jgi:hypothetical protein